MSSQQRTPAPRDHLSKVLGEMRPRLHAYLARVTGSVIDGEDVVQDAMAKAVVALSQGAYVTNIEGWMFRIAHNSAMDFLRRRSRLEKVESHEDLDFVEDPFDSVRSRDLAATSIHTFMRIPVAQRSTIILLDVLGYSIQEVAEFLAMTVPAVKAAIHRGRNRLRELALESEDAPAPRLSAPERAQLDAYVDRFNARDFDAVREMLADEVELEVVNRSRLRGKSEVSTYFGNYTTAHKWQFAAGFVEGRPAALALNPLDRSAAPTYFVLLQWLEGKLVNIRDFGHARYVTDGLDFTFLAEVDS